MGLVVRCIHLVCFSRLLWPSPLPSGCSDEVLTLQEEFSFELASLEELLQRGRKLSLYKLEAGTTLETETMVRNAPHVLRALSVGVCHASLVHVMQKLRQAMGSIDAQRAALHQWALSQPSATKPR